MRIRYTVVLTEEDQRFMDECQARQGMNHSQVVRLALEKLRANPVFSLAGGHTIRRQDGSDMDEVPA